MLKSIMMMVEVLELIINEKNDWSLSIGIRIPIALE